MQPLRRNLGAYCGERIHVEAVLTALCQAAEAHHCPVHWQPVGDSERLLAIHAPVSEPRRRIYLSAGIHGDEPAGPLAVLNLLRTGSLPADVELWICPMLNPDGFERNTREDATGRDLNRDYRHRKAARIRSHIAWLGSIPRFDCGIHLHEDWEATGFYLYELNPRGRKACSEQVVDEVGRICPIDHADMIDGRRAEGGILRPQVDPESREDWPEAFYMVQQKTDISYTLESPSDFPLPTRVAALTTAVRTILAEVCS